MLAEVKDGRRPVQQSPGKPLSHFRDESLNRGRTQVRVQRKKLQIPPPRTRTPVPAAIAAPNIKAPARTPFRVAAKSPAKAPVRSPAVGQRIQPNKQEALAAPLISNRYLGLGLRDPNEEVFPSQFLRARAATIKRKEEYERIQLENPSGRWYFFVPSEAAAA